MADELVSGSDDSTSGQHNTLTQWALLRGLSIYGIRPEQFLHHGSGIVATRDIKAGDILAMVPTRVLLTVDSVPEHIKNTIEVVTVHGLLAAALALDAQSEEPSWRELRAAMPSREDFQKTMPVLWDREMHQWLPPTARGIVHLQQCKLGKDFEAVTRAFPSVSKDDYTYFWLIVNTRTFYYVSPSSEVKRSHEDCMALCPFVDYFNHADHGCHVSFEESGFQVTSDRSYAAGDEIFVSYGSHSNDFLLAEYGFILPDNQWDELSIDHLIIPSLTELQRADLKEAGFLGNYVLDNHTICYRTEVAIHRLILPSEQWRRFLSEGALKGTDTEMVPQRVNTSLMKIIEGFQAESHRILRILRSMDNGVLGRIVLDSRWTQISSMLEANLDRLRNSTRRSST